MKISIILPAKNEAEGLDPDKLEFRNERERQAHDLLAKKGGSVEVLSENRMPGVGIQYVANVVVDADRREYRCELTIDDEGRVRRADQRLHPVV